MTDIARFATADEIVGGSAVSRSECLMYVSQLEEGCTSGSYRLVALCTDFFIATQLDLPNRSKRMAGLKEIIATTVRLFLEMFPKATWPHVEVSDDGSVQMGSVEKRIIPDKILLKFQPIIDELRSTDATSAAAAARLLLQFIQFGGKIDMADTPELYERFSGLLGAMKHMMMMYILEQLGEMRQNNQ